MAKKVTTTKITRNAAAKPDARLLAAADRAANAVGQAYAATQGQGPAWKATVAALARVMA
jgi:hypothetical protein